MKERLETLVVKMDTLKKMERTPMKLIKSKTAVEKQIVSQTPRFEEDKKYKFSKDKGKEKNKAIRDKMVRELKRTKKAAKRELKIDGQFIERKRREERIGKRRKEARGEESGGEESGGEEGTNDHFVSAALGEVMFRLAAPTGTVRYEYYVLPLSFDVRWKCK